VFIRKASPNKRKKKSALFDVETGTGSPKSAFNAAYGGGISSTRRGKTLEEKERS